MFKTLISADQLATLLGQTDLLVVDCRHDLMNASFGSDAYMQSRIPGAIFVDVEKQLAGRHTGQNGRHPLPEIEAFRAFVAGLGVQPTTQVVVYDSQSGQSAGRLWWMLRWIGHAQAAVLDGGWACWAAAGHPVETGAPSAAARPSHAPAPTPDTAPAPTVDVQGMIANLASRAYTVIDARAGARYRGETEPLDPVAGHIPGALNRPFQDNLQPDGRFKPAAMLRQEFSALLGPVAPQAVVHQCGSGISACHNLLAMEHAGLSGSLLYPGSWSEWCADPARPVAIGEPT